MTAQADPRGLLYPLLSNLEPDAEAQTGTQTRGTPTWRRRGIAAPVVTKVSEEDPAAPPNLGRAKVLFEERVAGHGLPKVCMH